MDATAVLVAAIGAVASVAAAFFTARSATRAAQAKSNADEHAAIRQIEAGAAERARQVYEGALGRMQAEIDRQARQVNALQRQVTRLTKQIREAGLVPVVSSEEDSQ